VGLEWITPKYTYFNVCWNEQMHNEVLEPVTFVLAYPTVFPVLRHDSVKVCRRRVEHPNALTSALRQK